MTIVNIRLNNNHQHAMINDTVFELLLRSKCLISSIDDIVKNRNASIMTLMNSPYLIIFFDFAMNLSHHLFFFLQTLNKHHVVKKPNSSSKINKTISDKLS